MLLLNGSSLTLPDVKRAAIDNEQVGFTDAAIAAMRKSRAYIETKINQQAAIYGVNTGFGKLADTRIPPEETEALQRNLIMSHACGMGAPLPESTVRAVMLLRLNALSRGNSGIRPETLETLLAMLNRGVHPVIPEKGSLGASGDLAPLAHMALVLIGQGEAMYRGERLPGGEAMHRAGIAPVTLRAKEGLALINGTQVMTAVGALAYLEADDLCRAADLAASLTAQALRARTDAYDARAHALRGHPGQIQSAACLRELLHGSTLAQYTQPDRVQDAYSLRCVPQVHGASRDAIEHVGEVLSREINAVTDNPLIFPEDDLVISGGNFHGQPVALAMDYMAIAASELADISERRLERMVNPQLNLGLPPFLAVHGGVNSGFMIVQYCAAALVSENKALSHPASVDSIPSSGNQEDHVSMGTIAARKAREIIGNARKVLALEVFTAAQAISLRGEDGLSPATRPVYDRIRREIPALRADAVMYPLINAAERLLSSGELTALVKEYTDRGEAYAK